jgi:hypothetical protein
LWYFRFAVYRSLLWLESAGEGRYVGSKLYQPAGTPLSGRCPEDPDPPLCYTVGYRHVTDFETPGTEILHVSILSDETVDTVARVAESEQAYQDFRPTVYNQQYELMLMI